MLYAWNRVGIDFRQWFTWKHQFGMDFLRRAKNHMKLEVVGDHDRGTVL